MGLSNLKIFEWLRAALREHAESLVLALILALLVRWFVLAAYIVRSDVMAPSLLKGDVVIGFKPPFGVLGAHGREPLRGELVIFNCPGGANLCLRRVMGLPGDRMEMTKQRLAVNGDRCLYSASELGKQVLSEKCSSSTQSISVTPDWEEESWGPIICPPNHIFLLNDYRPDREDSRMWGAVPTEKLESTAVAVWISFDWSASKVWPMIRWERTFLRVN